MGLRFNREPMTCCACAVHSYLSYLRVARRAWTPHWRRRERHCKRTEEAAVGMGEREVAGDGRLPIAAMGKSSAFVHASEGARKALGWLLGPWEQSPGYFSSPNADISVRHA